MLFFHRLPTRCVDTSESPSPSPSFNPSPTNQNGDSISLAVVATAVVVPLSLTLLIVTVVVVLVLLYMGLVRRRRSSKTGGDIERSDGADEVDNFHNLQYNVCYEHCPHTRTRMLT